MKIIKFVYSIYKCPLRLLIGVPCPLCGMTRAFLSALSGDFAAAFYYHPLWPLAVIALLVLAARGLKLIRLSNRFIDRSAMIIAAAFIICYIIRHILGSPVVAADYSEGILSALFIGK